MSPSVTTGIHFLKPSPLYSHEKPYAFRFEVEDGAIPQSNMTMEEVQGIEVIDIRGREKSFTLESHNFEVAKLALKLNNQDAKHDMQLLKYFEELEKLLKKRLGAEKVMIFRHGIRKRHPDFPVSTGKAYEYEQPTSVAHIDTTVEEMLEEAKRQMGSQADEHLKKGMEWINIWKPLRGPLNDWPLTVCDGASVDPTQDLIAADLLYPDLLTENFQVHHSERQKWYFLSDHEIDEIIMFRQASNIPGALPGIPHCSFFNPNTRSDEPPRESIEARALVFYGE